MLFDVRPKISRKDLYNFEKEMEEIIRNLDKPMIVVSGLRRTGKTSLVLTSLRESNSKFLLIDLREGFRSYRELYLLLSKSVNDFILSISYLEKIKDLFLKFLKSLRGVSITDYSVSFSWGKDRFLLTEFFERLNEFGEKIGERIIVVFDEFQKSTGNLGLVLQDAISYSYDYHRNISFILTGSEMGILYGILKNPKNPLFGRAFININTRKLNKEESVDFLEKGFSELNIKVSKEEVEKVASELDGIIGWLTYYGYQRMIRKEDFEEIKKDAVELAKQELENFIKLTVSKRYKIVLKLLAEEIKEWSSLKRNVEKYEGKEISNRVLYEILQQLKRHSIIDEENNFTDPIYKEASKLLS
jgi:AAA+ ATPase superfamily predicted ATPase